MVQSTTFLGIRLDSQLQWLDHVRALANKLNFAARAIRRIIKFTEIAIARLVYISYFHSIISYVVLLNGKLFNIYTS